jgi:hypothetical protein
MNPHHESRPDEVPFNYRRTRETDFSKKICLARIKIPNWPGEKRFNLAPCSDGSWYIWGDYHYSQRSRQPDDAAYDFANGGAYFPTKEEAMAYTYDYLSGLCRDFAEEKSTATNANEN